MLHVRPLHINEERFVGPDNMSNELTHGLAAAVAASTISLLAGKPAISAPVFLAGFAGMLINLDRGGAMNGSRTPYGHSLVFGIFWLYASAICVYFVHISGMLSVDSALWYLVAFAAAYFSHLALDAFSGEGIFIVPLARGNKARDWNNWTRLRIVSKARSRASSGELNVALVSVMMACIALA